MSVPFNDDDAFSTTKSVEHSLSMLIMFGHTDIEKKKEKTTQLNQIIENNHGEHVLQRSVTLKEREKNTIG